METETDTLTQAPSLDEQLQRSLLQIGAIKEADLQRARRIRQEQLEQDSIGTLLVRLGMVSERTIAEQLAQLTDLKLFKTSEFPTTPVLPELLPLRFLKDQQVMPISESDGVITLAMANPENSYPIKAIEMATEMKVQPGIGVASELVGVLDRLYSAATDKADRESVDFSEQDVEQLRDMASEAPVIRLVNKIIQRAVDERASDIHIEPFENQLKVRQRVDGVLRDEHSPPLQMAPAIISRVKIMAGLDIAERRLPQDGRINQRVQGADIDIRVSTVPTMYGESLVLRLLKRESVALDFDSLGFTDKLKKQFIRALDMPHGMIIVTGPTGSGKTTTLYTALNSLNTEERKVITVEDPVEYNLEGINQIQVNPSIGLSFANALRSIMRQDPDVIMVGEMRDLETAKICVQSSLTGHLVLSTLHTNDAASSITRLLEMGVEDYLLNSTLHTVLAQRLVRVLCKQCRETYTPRPELVSELKLDQFTDGQPVQLFRRVGCEACGGTGYKGRTGIIEQLVISERIRELVLQHAGASVIEKVAREEGMDTLFEDGCKKALQGITSIEEVVRVTQEG
ncbi:type II secretion system ATPase GspE [Porticoccaceae bacterium LTM1]|nr:type II secretion system ATPase GspE [Porticoccaceae bacterium LTM1]